MIDKARLIELNHVIEDGMITYKGLPAPIICDYLSRADSRNNYAPGTEFQIGRIDMALDDVRRRSPANQPDVVQSLEKRRASLNDALTRLMA